MAEGVGQVRSLHNDCDWWVEDVGQMQVFRAILTSGRQGLTTQKTECVEIQLKM